MRAGSPRLTRRSALLLAAAGAAGAQTRPGTLREAPALAARVQANALPPVVERVGQEPMVVRPHRGSGRYGGNLRSALRGGGDHNGILRLVGNQGLVRWNPTLSGVEPNVANAWEVNADATAYTFRLRRGMRWSDGTPFTADDLVFAMNDLVFNREFMPAVPARYVVAGRTPTVEKLDDSTVRFVFAAPYGRFLEELATPLGQHPTLFQRAWCSRFHPAHAGMDTVAQLVREARVADWPALMRLRAGDIEAPSRWANPQRPTLDPWVIEQPYTGGVARVVLRRNPFFWQVDTEGNQLPYIDTITLPVISDLETILLRTIGGEIDLQLRHVNTIQNRPVLEENADRGRYTVFNLQTTSASVIGLYLNLCAKNERLRTLFRNRRFREAVSHGINRTEIIDSVLLGHAEPHQVGPARSHPLFNEKLATQHLAHEPATANRILDELGFTRRDSGNVRLWPDGSKLVIVVDATVSEQDAVDGLGLVRRDLAQIGIEVAVNVMERSLFWERSQRNDHEASFTLVPGGLNPTEERRAVVADNALESRQALPWQRWYETAGREGEEPSESMRRRFALLDRWRATADAAQANAVFAELLAIAAEEFEVIGIARPLGIPGVRSRRLQNVPDPMINAWTAGTPAYTLPQQYFFDS